MAEFWAMGGRAIYIWPAYGVAALILLGGVALTRVTLRKQRAEVKRLEAGRS